MLIGGGCSLDGGLLDDETQAFWRWECAEECYFVPEELVVELPAFQIGDGRGFGFLMGAVNDEEAEEVWPCGFEVGGLVFIKPDLMLVALLVGGAAQLVWRGAEDEAGFIGIGAENSEFLLVIGRTSLKARNCFTASS